MLHLLSLPSCLARVHTHKPTHTHTHTYTYTQVTERLKVLPQRVYRVHTEDGDDESAATASPGDDALVCRRGVGGVGGVVVWGLLLLVVLCGLIGRGRAGGEE